MPAHVVASMREDGAFAAVDNDVRTRQASVISVDEWNDLDAFRTRQLARKQDRKRSIAMGSMVIWALVAGGAAFVWFRKIDWDGLTARLQRGQG
ncbi:MAG: hypothetical protein H6709_15650 [Kofleriaceae bacterium]|nr:hypothetical protein [Kofleriaceae bacterium]